MAEGAGVADVHGDDVDGKDTYCSEFAADFLDFMILMGLNQYGHMVLFGDVWWYLWESSRNIFEYG